MRRLLAANVLLAGLQGQHEAAPPVGVHGLPRDPARHPAQVLLGGAEEAERGTSEVEPASERLALADRDVDTAFPGRSQHPEGQRVDRGDRERARVLGGPGEGLEILDRAEEVRVLDEQGGGFRVERGAELARVREAALEANLDHLRAEAASVGAKRLAAVGMNATGDDQTPAPRGADRQVGGRGHRGGALVQRGVGHRQRAELRDRGLELEHHLEAALRDLGLVGRVRGQELRALCDRVHDCRHVVVVHPRPEEAELRVGVGVALGERGEMVEALGFREPRGEVEGTAQAQLGGDLGEQVVDRANADRVEHRSAVGVGG